LATYNIEEVKQMKGITPIISIIVLLLITVSLAGAAYIFLSNYMTGYTGQAIQASGVCVGGTVAYVTVTNMGTQAIDLGSAECTQAVPIPDGQQSGDCGDITVVRTDGGSMYGAYFEETSILAGEPGKLYKGVFRDPGCTTSGNPARCTYAFTRAGELQSTTVTVNCGG
jgi:flagellin-like protein